MTTVAGAVGFLEQQLPGFADTYLSYETEPAELEDHQDPGSSARSACGQQFIACVTGIPSTVTRFRIPPGMCMLQPPGPQTSVALSLPLETCIFVIGRHLASAWIPGKSNPNVGQHRGRHHYPAISSVSRPGNAVGGGQRLSIISWLRSCSPSLHNCLPIPRGSLPSHSTPTPANSHPSNSFTTVTHLIHSLFSFVYPLIST